MNEEGRTTPLVDQIVATLEQAIAAGEFAPGERLSELSLAATLGVSRAPLREAFRKLEGRRIVERNAAGTVRVQSLTLEDLEQLLNVRETLEGMASRCAALCMSVEDIADLRACAMQKKLELEGLGSVFQNNSQDHDFHVKIARGSGNRSSVKICMVYCASTVTARVRWAFVPRQPIANTATSSTPSRSMTLTRPKLLCARTIAMAG